jgi:hypothetical protein
MAQPPHGAPEDKVDEAMAESFPASDAPNWSAMHAGAPTPRPWVAEHARELRAALRADVERLARAMANARDSERRGEQRTPLVEDVAAHAILDAGRAVIREPVDESLRTWNLEAEQLGTEREGACVVVGATLGTDDPSGAALLLAIIRALGPVRMRRTVRFAVLASDAGSERLAERLRRDGSGVHAMLSLGHLDLTREPPAPYLDFVGNFRSGAFARGARDAFRYSSRIRARAVVLPSWLLGALSPERSLLWRQGWPAVMATDAPLWRRLPPPTVAPDVDRMAAAVPGLASAVARLAGGRV